MIFGIAEMYGFSIARAGKICQGITRQEGREQLDGYT